MTRSDRRSDIVARLRAAGCVFAEDEAGVLLATTNDPGQLDAMVERRSAGVPLEQVVGWADFAGIRVVVHPGVFVPRVRTQALVRASLAVLPERAVVVDLCCGSGSIGAAIAAARPQIELYASDIDAAAIACARENLATYATGAFVTQADLDEGLPAQLSTLVDVMVANVPYVPSDEIAFLPAEARLHEARIALDGGADGLAVLRRVAGRAPHWLRRGGWLFTECAAAQHEQAAAVLGDAGLRPRVEIDDEFEVAIVAGRA